jgi:dTDP-4-amino-4,6-dideoxygalactose transaminase
MDAILEIANRRGLPVVEDCCPALGSTYRGRPVGTFGLAAYWSFDWTKTFTTGLGGMATTRDAALAERIAALCRARLCRPPAADALRLAAEHAVFRLAASPRTMDVLVRLHGGLARAGAAVPTFSAADFAPETLGRFLRRMGGLQARAGLREMRRLNRNVAHRRRLRDLYDRLFSEAGWPRPPLPAHLDPVLIRYPVRVANKEVLAAEARRRAADVQTWWESPIHPPDTPLERFGYRPGSCPVAERVSREVVTLPTDLRTSPAAARQIAALVLRVGRPAA